MTYQRHPWSPILPFGPATGLALDQGMIRPEGRESLARFPAGTSVSAIEP